MKMVSEDNLHTIINSLVQGDVVVLSTDTVPIFSCRADKQESVDKIFKIKNRPIDKPIGVFVKDIGSLEDLVEITEKQRVVIKNYLPGKVTFVLNKRASFPSGVGTDISLGVRMSSHYILERILESVDFPLAQTSANKSGEPVIYSSQDIFNLFKSEDYAPDLILDFGTMKQLPSTTVVDMTSEEPRILRQGEIRVSFE